MPPAIIAGGIAAVGAIGGAVISSGAQKSAAKTAAAAQQQATSQELQLGRENIAFQQGIYNQNKALLNPFVSRGNDAGNSINALLGLGGTQAAQQGVPAAQAPAANAAAPQTQGYQTASPYTQMPLNKFAGDDMVFDSPAAARNYGAQNAVANPQAQQQDGPVAQNAAATPAAAGQTSAQSAQSAFDQFAHSAGMDFQLKQGENAINNGYAARGQIQSGAAMKALQNYGQSTALNNYFLPYMGLLQGQQATGAQSGAAIAGVGSNFGNTVSNIYGQQNSAIQNGADATSNAALLRGQANAGLWNTIGSSLGNLASSFVQPSGYGGGGGSPSYGRYY